MMHYLYRITNQLNNKVYIGQAVDPSRRWTDHKWNAKQENPIQYISRAMGKYGVENFIFEVIATCRTQEDANETETILIQQYNSRDKQFGYNIKPGGNNAPHAEETKEKMRQATIQQIIEKGHPAAGRIVTEEERELHRKARLEKPIEYTSELRKKMSESHIGIKDSEETKKRKSESAKEAWEKRIDYSRKCEAPGCDVSGKAKYKIIDGIRYCNKHGLRMLRYNRLDTLDS
jgi:group I intron endonuclease